MFRIGDFSKLTRVSVKALRFYDEVGLLKPTYVDRDTGYRYYSATLLPRLNRILAFKELGLSLEEIIHLLEGDLPVDRVREALQSRRAELARRIERERAQLVEVEAWLAQIERAGRVPDYEVTVKHFAPRLVASVRDTLSSYADADDLFDELHSNFKHRGAPLERGAIWHTCAGRRRSIDCEAILFLREPRPPAGRRSTNCPAPSSPASSIRAATKPANRLMSPRCRGSSRMATRSPDRTASCIGKATLRKTAIRA